jgi:carbamoyl-phosphate synthase small subunit
LNKAQEIPGKGISVEKKGNTGRTRLTKNNTEPKDKKAAVLALSDGTVLKGQGFGSPGKASGEVVFNTGMVGYPESITDPSYYGQILIQTYPLIGNYGVDPGSFESDSPKIRGYVVHELHRKPKHWASSMSLDEWLRQNRVPAIEQVDTRMLTKKIRTYGTILGLIQVFENEEEMNLESIRKEAEKVIDPNLSDLVKEVATKKTMNHDVGGKLRIVLIDLGFKRNILNNLLSLKANVTVVPPTLSEEKIMDLNPDGILISNGPGDAKKIPYVIETVKALVERSLPMMGVCFGLQVIGLALGGDTYKLKFGHRGQNHPCIDLDTGKCYITSQNHGYALDANSLDPTTLRVTQINANDHTVEGISHKSLPISAVQYHPEAAPGPEDTAYLYTRFVDQIQKSRG